MSDYKPVGADGVPGMELLWRSTVEDDEAIRFMTDAVKPDAKMIYLEET